MADIKKQQELAKELSSKLWDMANDLRGNMEAYEFKNYILGLLFYKELSDRTEKFVAKILEEDNVDFQTAWKDDEYKEAIIDEMLIKLGYVLEPKYLFPHMLELIRKDEFSIDYFEEAINSIIASTQGQDSEQDFDGLFEDMDLKSSKLGKEVKQRGKLIGRVLQTIDSIEVDFSDTDVDVLGTAYVILIGLFAQTAGKKGGEFYTPTNMSKLVARLATVGLTKVLSVADCACGSGSLLLQVGEYVDVAKYYGQELTSSTYNLARMNMILHNIDYKNFSIINVDTLENDTIFGGEKYTIQVANPPYSTKWSADDKFMDDERFSPYGKLAPKTKADFAFVQHMVYHMAPGDSRIAVLLPHGVLFRGAAEETIRKYLIKDLNVIDAVIGLPANCFQGTSIPVCCLVLKKERNGNSGNICFIDASKEFVKEKTQNYITEDHIEKIVKAYSDRKDIEKYCHIATIDEIKKNDYNLNIPRYVDTSEEEPEIDLSAVTANIKDIDTEISKVSVELEKSFKELGLVFPF
ncbi:type I restriction-modification system subunit M [Pseudobutyrivibrio sp. LB2011]|uniref:type I restriction-modification system subunit M n=1 Tax=Pseudobutyrivibrio sp. LB2011 TaxID=1408312 RepID=UPI0005D20DE2|nr:type I restriction-modification system subunit M [Pseudobutyrivibrio sp. LB2011]